MTKSLYFAVFISLLRFCFSNLDKWQLHVDGNAYLNDFPSKLCQSIDSRCTPTAYKLNITFRSNRLSSIQRFVSMTQVSWRKIGLVSHKSSFTGIAPLSNTPKGISDCFIAYIPVCPAGCGSTRVKSANSFRLVSAAMWKNSETFKGLKLKQISGLPYYLSVNVSLTLRNSISKPFVTRPPFHQYQGGRTTKKVTPKTPTVPTATKEKPRLTTKSHTKPGGKSSEELKIYSTLHSETSEKTVAILPTTGGTKSNVMDSSKETASKLTSTKIIASSFTTEHMLVPEKTTDYTKYGKLESENSETAKSLSDDLTAATTEIENNTDKLKMTNNKPQLTTSYARNVEKLQKEVKSDATGTYHSTTPSQSIRVSITDRQELTVSVSHKKQGKTTEKSDLQNATSEEPSVEIKSVSQKTAVKYSEKLFIKETTTSNLDETAENKKYQKATRTTNCSAGTQSPVPKNEVTKETTTLSWYVTDKIDKMTPLLRTKGTDSGHIDDQLESSQSPTRANKELETTVNEFTPVKTTFDDRHETTEKSHSNTADTLGLFDDLSTTRSFTGHQIDHSETSEFQSSILLPQTKAEMPQISSSPKPKVPQATEDTGKLENNSESFATKIYPITKSKESAKTDISNYSTGWSSQIKSSGTTEWNKVSDENESSNTLSGAAYSTSLEEIKKNVTTEMSGRGFVSNSPKVNDNLHQTSRSESIQETTERIRTQTTSEKFNYFTSQTQPELTSSAEPLSSSTAASKDWLKSEKHYAKPIEESASTNVAVGGTKFSLSGIKTTTFYPDINKISPVSTEFVTGKNAKIQTDSSRINISKSTIVLSSSVENLSKITQTTAKLITGTNLAQKTTFTAKKMTNAFEPKQNETATTTHNRNVAGSTSGIQATAELHDKGHSQWTQTTSKSNEPTSEITGMKNATFMEFGNQSAIDMTVVQVSTITGSYLTTQVTNTSQMAGITEFISKPVTSTRSTQDILPTKFTTKSGFKTTESIKPNYTTIFQTTRNISEIRKLVGSTPGTNTTAHPSIIPADLNTSVATSLISISSNAHSTISTTNSNDCVRRIGKSMFCAPPNRPCSCRFANSTLLDCNLNCNRPCAVNYDCVRPIVHLPNSNRMAILMSQCKNYECLLEVKNLKLPICGNCSSKCQIRTDGSLAHCDGVDIKSAENTMEKIWPMTSTFLTSTITTTPSQTSNISESPVRNSSEIGHSSTSIVKVKNIFFTTEQHDKQINAKTTDETLDSYSILTTEDPFSTDNVTFKVESISTTSETTFVTGPSDTFTQSTMNQSSISLTTSLLLKDLSSNTTHENASKTTELSSVSHNYGTTESSLQSPKEINETNDATEKETPFEVPIDTAESHVDGSDSNGNGQAAEEFAIDIPPDDNNEEEFHPEQNGPSHDFEENPDDVPNEDENGDGQVIVGFPAMEESEMEENSNGGGEEIQSESNGVTEENFAQGADY